MTNGTYPTRLELEAPAKVANWRPLVSWLLAIPHLIILYGLRAFRVALLVISFFTVLFTEEIPEGIFNVIVMTRRYSWRVTSYVLWMREKYPPFDFTMTAQDDGIDPASVSIDRPQNLNRFAPLYKWILAIPHFIVLVILSIGAVFSVLIAFFAVLFTGKWPQGLRDYVIAVSRWGLRVGAYAGFLTDVYPPFSLAAGGGAASTGEPMGGAAPPPPPPPPPETPIVPPPPPAPGS